MYNKAQLIATLQALNQQAQMATEQNDACVAMAFLQASEIVLKALSTYITKENSIVQTSSESLRKNYDKVLSEKEELQHKIFQIKEKLAGISIPSDLCEALLSILYSTSPQSSDTPQR